MCNSESRLQRSCEPYFSRQTTSKFSQSAFRQQPPRGGPDLVDEGVHKAGAEAGRRLPLVRRRWQHLRAETHHHGVSPMDQPPWPSMQRASGRGWAWQPGARRDLRNPPLGSQRASAARPQRHKWCAAPAAAASGSQRAPRCPACACRRKALPSGLRQKLPSPSPSAGHAASQAHTHAAIDSTLPTGRCRQIRDTR